MRQRPILLGDLISSAKNPFRRRMPKNIRSHCPVFRNVERSSRLSTWYLTCPVRTCTIIGLAPLLVGPQPWNQYELTLGMVSVVGFLLALVNGCLMAILQATIPPDMQGRVFSMISSGAGAMMPLGYALAGPLADAFGVQFWFILSGVVTFATGLACVFMPSVMEIEKTPIQSWKTVAELAELVDTSSSDTDTE